MPVLLRDPVLRSVSVAVDPLAVIPTYTVECKFRYWKTVDPTDITVSLNVTDENLPADFFQTDIAGLVATAVIEDGTSVSGGFDLPPVAQDTTVWDPTTNAPY